MSVTIINTPKTVTKLTLGTKKLTLLHFGPRGLAASQDTGIALSSGATQANFEVPASPTNGYALTYDATSGKFKPTAIAGSGTVTSVALSVPTGLSVSGSPITGAGTFTITFAAGYSIPTDANQANWATAYGWGNHASAGYLTAETDPVFTASAAAGIAGGDITNWNTAYGWGNHASAGYILSTEKGAANGVATLGADSKIPVAQLPAAVLGALSYQGTWNATTNSPTIPVASSNNRGYYYKVATAGSTNVDGITDWLVGDWIVSNGTTWDQVDNTDLVSSVNGQAGAVVLGYGDVGAEPAIAAGTTAQYWRGDKGWRDFATDVRGSVLTSLSLVTSQVIAATDTVLQALGYLQAQITAYKDATLAFTQKTIALGSNTVSGTLAQFNTACTDADFADKATLIGKVYLGYWPAAALKPATTNGCAALAWAESTTNKVMTGYLAFDAAAIEYGSFSFKAPQGLDEGTFTAIFEWQEAGSASSHDCVWQIEIQAQGDGDTIDSAWGTAVTVTDTGTSGTRRFAAETGAITPGGTWTAGDEIIVRVSRKATDGSDTLNVDAYLFGVTLYATNTTLVEP